MGPYCRSCGGSCPSTGCQKARFVWGFDGCLLKARLDGIDVKPLDMCKWLYCHETDTKMSLVPNGADSYIEFHSERDINPCDGAESTTDKIYICDLLGLASIDCLGDVEIDDPKPCDLLVYHPFCGDADCDDCNLDKKNKWINYHIPDAGDCVIPQTSDGYYKVLIKDACGCIKECKLPIVADNNTVIAAVRDSLPDDPDFPWYYGIYNENAIELKLAEVAPEYFGKYDLEVDIDYGVQVVHPGAGINMNWRSLVIPYVQGETPNFLLNSYVLQDDTTTAFVSQGASLDIPWGTKSMRGHIKFIVPKGKEGYLRHEFRFRSAASYAGSSDHYAHHSLDGKRAPDNLVTAPDLLPYNASRMNALHLSIRPTKGATRDKTSLTTPRGQLDGPTDIAPQNFQG